MEPYIKLFQSERIWTLDFAIQLTGNISSAKSLMASYTRKGFVSSVRRDMYVANDLAFGVSLVNKFEIASNIATGCYVAYHSALEYYGLAHQQSFEVQVCSPKRFRSFSFEGLSYHYNYSKTNDGVVANGMDSRVRVTDLERSIVDCIDHVNLAGGFEELMNCLSACVHIDMDKIMCYAKLYGKKVLFRKIGLICALFSDSWKPSKDQIRELKELSGDSLLLFTDRNESTRFLSSWNMYVPEQMCEYLKSSADEII